MAVQVSLLNFDPREGSWKMTIFYVFAFALSFQIFRHLARIYSEYKVCRLLRSYRNEPTNNRTDRYRFWASSRLPITPRTPQEITSWNR